MKTVRVTYLGMVLVASTMLSAQANAQDAGAATPPAITSPRVDATGFVSMDSRGSTPVGVAISFPLSPRVGIEAEVAYRRGEGDLSALSSSANLLYALPRIGRAAPYFAGGVGLAQSGSPIVSREGSVIGTQPAIALEVNAGGGVKVPVDDTWGMRTDARWFKSLGRNGGEHFRVSQGISFDVGKR